LRTEAVITIPHLYLPSPAAAEISVFENLGASEPESRPENSRIEKTSPFSDDWIGWLQNRSLTTGGLAH
jgi:hypothetical protein